MVQIVTRRQWGAAFTIPTNRHVPPSARRFTVIHWPGGNVSGDEAGTVRAFERQHRGQGWAAAPGYNYIVGQSGTIFEGCGRDVRGAHSPPRNTDGWGICVLQPINGRPTQAALNATRALRDWLCHVAGRQLTMSWHGQHHPTACPGPDLTAWVRSGMPAAGGPPSREEDNEMTPEQAHTLDIIRYVVEHQIRPQTNRLVGMHENSDLVRWGILDDDAGLRTQVADVQNRLSAIEDALDVHTRAQVAVDDPPPWEDPIEPDDTPPPDA